MSVPKSPGPVDQPGNTMHAPAVDEEPTSVPCWQPGGVLPLQPLAVCQGCGWSARAADNLDELLCMNPVFVDLAQQAMGARAGVESVLGPDSQGVGAAMLLRELVCVLPAWVGVPAGPAARAAVVEDTAFRTAVGGLLGVVGLVEAFLGDLRLPPPKGEAVGQPVPRLVALRLGLARARAAVVEQAGAWASGPGSGSVGVFPDAGGSAPARARAAGRGPAGLSTREMGGARPGPAVDGSGAS